MAVARKNNYITDDLDWAEAQLARWKTYIDENPMHELDDRIKYKEVKGVAVPYVVASIEIQGKFLQETMKNYLALLEVVDKLRESEAKKNVETRGNVAMSAQAEDFLNSRKKNNE
jgi:hypothetical protein